MIETEHRALTFRSSQSGESARMLYAALLLPMVLMASLFGMARLESWIGREPGLRAQPAPAPPQPGTAPDVRRTW
jgi:hypothetical protein